MGAAVSGTVKACSKRKGSFRDWVSFWRWLNSLPLSSKVLERVRRHITLKGHSPPQPALASLSLGLSYVSGGTQAGPQHGHEHFWQKRKCLMLAEVIREHLLSQGSRLWKRLGGIEVTSKGQSWSSLGGSPPSGSSSPFPQPPPYKRGVLKPLSRSVQLLLLNINYTITYTFTFQMYWGFMRTYCHHRFYLRKTDKGREITKAALP